MRGGTSLSPPCPTTGAAGWSQLPPGHSLSRPIVKLDLQVIDSPKTPATPLSPADITAVRSSAEVLSFHECVDIARAVRYCSKSLIDGTWSEESTIRGRRPIFTPNGFESAK